MEDFVKELLTDEGFFKKVYRKGNSKEAENQARSAVNNFELYCQNKIKKSRLVILNQLKLEYKKTHETGKVINLLRGFIDWSLEDHPDVLRKMNNSKIEKPVKAVGKSTVKPYIAQIRKYFKSCFAIKLDDDDYKDDVLDYIGPDDSDDEESGADPFTPEELFHVLSNANPKRPRRLALYYTGKDTAGRIKELLQLKKKHFDTSFHYTKVYFPKGIVKWRRRSKTCFLTPETEKLIKPLLADLTDEDYVFRDNNHDIMASKSNELRAFRTLLDGLSYTKKRKKRHTKSFHSIRKFCMKQISLELDESTARDYGGHTDWGKVYFSKSNQEKMETFEKCMPKLCLFEKYEIQPATAQELSNLKQKLDSIENYVYSTRQPMLEQLATNPQVFWKNYRIKNFQG